nr:MAG TPA: Protein involved in gliding motility 9 Secretion System Type.5A [Bacteriophage sp.]
MKKNFLMKMKRSMMAIFSVVAMGMITASLAACSSSEDESEKEAAKVKEYLAGNEWTINSTSGTYSYYKNHLVYYEDGGGLTPGGYVVEPNVAFGHWQMEGDRLTTRFEVGTPKSFNIGNLLNETISGVHLQESNKITGSRVSVSIDMRPLIVGTFANGNECQMRCGNSLNDISDETDHDAAIRGTWYCIVTMTKDGKKRNCMGSMTFNEDGTMHMVIEGEKDFTTTYSTKNGKVTINGYLVENHVATFYYTNLYGSLIKLYNCENGYLSSIWRKNRDEAYQ